MNALIEQFDLLATSTGGIAKLRELILSLAVRGQLVPQDANDEPASELLKKIRAEKDRLIKEKVFRKGKPTPEIEEHECAFDLPQPWEWVRLGEIGDWGAGATPPRGNADYYGGSIPWFKSGELTADFISESEETVTDAALQSCSLRANKVGDVLVAMYGATIGKTAILSVPATTNQAVCACTPYSGFENRYLLLMMKALKPYFISQGAGGAQPNISREKIIATVVGLPPTAEQSRIVAKVEELMALCDRLEAEQGHALRVQGHWVEAAIDQLAKSADADEFRRHWQHLAEHFDTLFTTPESIERLNATLLQLAVRGKLVAQDSNDEPASELLKQIRAEKDRLILEGKIKRDKPLPPITEDEKPYALPEGWEWVRLADLCSLVTDGTHQTPKYVADGKPFLSAQNIKPFRFMPENYRCVSEADFDSLRKNRTPEFGDILITRVGAMIGEAAVIDKPIEFAFYVSLGLLKPVKPFCDSSYITLWLNSPDGTASSVRNTLGRGVSAGNLNLSLIRQFVIPVPPTGEQSRIVAQVEKLLALTAELKARLTAAQTKQAHLAETLIEEALTC